MTYQVPRLKESRDIRHSAGRGELRHKHGPEGPSTVFKKAPLLDEPKRRKKHQSCRNDLALLVNASFAWGGRVNSLPGTPKLARRTKAALFGDALHVELSLAKQFLGISNA